MARLKKKKKPIAAFVEDPRRLPRLLTTSKNHMVTCAICHINILWYAFSVSNAFLFLSFFLF